ncbi:hypothetical protein EYZ11_010420 [Aspergillus tanneri]|uniref:Uncharacterized protein n=1 Tax=Aspergillus tanneri TaxID=1220188 RepID=A0A4S3JAT0_9EURO|nr:hypothetical protein EYZ11_010420 [Aspergillus tanneri]
MFTDEQLQKLADKHRWLAILPLATVNDYTADAGSMACNTLGGRVDDDIEGATEITSGGECFDESHFDPDRGQEVLKLVEFSSAKGFTTN